MAEDKVNLPYRQFAEVIFESGLLNLGHLDERHRQVLFLVVIRNLTFEEIGISLDISGPRVAEIYREALMSLQYDLKLFFVLYNAFKKQDADGGLPAEISATDKNRITKELLDTRLVYFNLSVRALNIMKGYNIETLRQLAELDRSDLLRFRNMGPATIHELRELLYRFNLHLGMKFEKEKKDSS